MLHQVKEVSILFVGKSNCFYPELYCGLPYTDKCDVFSTAIILWELCVRVIKGKYELPYPHLKKDYQVMDHMIKRSSVILTSYLQILYSVAKNATRPPIPTSCPHPLESLVKRCWDPKPEHRPTS